MGVLGGVLLEQFQSLPRIMLPMQQQLILDELGAGSVDDFSPKTLVLKQLQKMETL